MVTVLHYTDRWLELSAGFVFDQVRRSRYRAVVLSREHLVNAAAFPHRPVHSLSALPRRVPPPLLTAAIGARALTARARVLHVHFGYAVHDVAGVVRRLRLPFVLSLHGHDVTALPGSSPDYYRAAADLAAAVVVPSQHFARLVTGLGFPAERIHVIPAGVDTSFFVPSELPSDPVVTFVGRLVEKKGIDVLAAAWPLVRSAVRSARLVVVGDGPLAHLLPADADHHRPEPSRRSAQVRDALHAARVVVTPSRTAASGDQESLLLVNLEAQASGRPVVTTRHGGIPEYVDEGRTALVVPENDPAALARALVEVLTDDALAQRLAAAGPAWAARFDVTECAARVDDVYDEVLDTT